MRGYEYAAEVRRQEQRELRIPMRGYEPKGVAH